jgi:hypothetical protein
MYLRICHDVGQLFEVTVGNAQQPQGMASEGGSASRRHLWVLWLEAWPQFSHQKKLYQAWSDKNNSSFI